jgi:hypothetical protein
MNQALTVGASAGQTSGNTSSQLLEFPICARSTRDGEPSTSSAWRPPFSASAAQQEALRSLSRRFPFADLSPGTTAAREDSVNEFTSRAPRSGSKAVQSWPEYAQNSGNPHNTQQVGSPAAGCCVSLPRKPAIQHLRQRSCSVLKHVC